VPPKPVEPRTSIDRDLQRLESDLKQLEAEYNMFFSGRLSKPPWETRSRVEALVRALGFGPRPDGDDAEARSEKASGDTREAILERLARHEITADDAAAAIRSLGRNRS
jgi:hypothetical protein